MSGRRPRGRRTASVGSVPITRSLPAAFIKPPAEKAAREFDRLRRARNQDRYEAKPVGATATRRPNRSRGRCSTPPSPEASRPDRRSANSPQEVPRRPFAANDARRLDQRITAGQTAFSGCHRQGPTTVENTGFRSASTCEPVRERRRLPPGRRCCDSESGAVARERQRSTTRRRAGLLSRIHPRQDARRLERDPGRGRPTPPSTSNQVRPGGVRSSGHVPSGERRERRCSTASPSLPSGASGERGGIAGVVEGTQHAYRQRLGWSSSRKVSSAGSPCSGAGRPPLEQELLRRWRAPRGMRRATGRALELRQPLEDVVVVANDDRTEPSTRSQFQPPSSSRSPTRRSTRAETSTPK